MTIPVFNDLEMRFLFSWYSLNFSQIPPEAPEKQNVIVKRLLTIYLALFAPNIKAIIVFL